MKTLILTVLLVLGSFSAWADPGHGGECKANCIPPVTNVTNNYYTVGVGDEEFREGLAMGAASGSLQFDYSDSALQVGVGVGTYRGENAGAVGVAKRLGDGILLNAHYSNAGDHGAGGVGATFRF